MMNCFQDYFCLMCTSCGLQQTVPCLGPLLGIPARPTRGGPWACCLVADARVGRQVLLGEGSTVALDGQRVLPERAQKAGFEFEFSTIGAALRDAVK